jgi:DNA sulfur modification protein DndE
VDDATVQEQFRLHLHRGLGYLAADRGIRSIGGLARKAGDSTDQHAA